MQLVDIGTSFQFFQAFFSHHILTIALIRMWYRFIQVPFIYSSATNSYKFY